MNNVKRHLIANCKMCALHVDAHLQWILQHVACPLLKVLTTVSAGSINCFPTLLDLDAK